MWGVRASDEKKKDLVAIVLFVIFLFKTLLQLIGIKWDKGLPVKPQYGTVDTLLYVWRIQDK